MSIEKIEIGIEIQFSDMKIIEIEVNFVYRNITSRNCHLCRCSSAKSPSTHHLSLATLASGLTTASLWQLTSTRLPLAAALFYAS
jgi:hypothetical protein